MFTGIIEDLGILIRSEQKTGGLELQVQSLLWDTLKPDQSVSHNGICLTVTSISAGHYTVFAVPETIAKTTVASWEAGRKLNLERGLKLGDRLDGHLVQGHIDTTATCIFAGESNTGPLFRFSFPETFSALVIEKGSICIDGVSLTCFNLSRNEFDVALIPYTLQHTNFSEMEKGRTVNLEFDVWGKYLHRMHSLKVE